jgi:hypothetical protein
MTDRAPQCVALAALTLMARSTVFESISTRPSARNVIKLAQCRSA